MPPSPWKLSPSDFDFLWEECKRCFYLKVTGKLDRPQMPFPKIFNAIDLAMKTFYAGKPTGAMAPGVPAGTVMNPPSDWVESAPVTPPGVSSSCYIKGKFDTVLKLDDGGYAVIDFKTSDIRGDNTAKYSRQLHAYALALEHPAGGAQGLTPVTKLGLLVYDPKTFSGDGAGAASLGGKLGWLEIPRDDAAFRTYLGEVVRLLEKPEVPAAAPGCRLCQYRDAARRTGL